MTFVTLSFMRLCDKHHKPQHNNVSGKLILKSTSWASNPETIELKLTIPILRYLFLDVYCPVECTIFRRHSPMKKCKIFYCLWIDCFISLTIKYKKSFVIHETMLRTFFDTLPHFRYQKLNCTVPVCHPLLNRK